MASVEFKNGYKKGFAAGADSVEEGLPGWFGTFADMMTLLFAFFVLLAAISTMDPVKLQEMANSEGKSLGSKIKASGKAELEGDVVTDARVGQDPLGNATVNMNMNSSPPGGPGGDHDQSDCFISPTILQSNFNSPIMKEEIFGPILPIIAYQKFSNAIHNIKNMESPLAAYIFSKQRKNINQFINRTQSGGVCINDISLHLIHDKLPFGGVGQSGIGRYHGKFGFDYVYPNPIGWKKYYQNVNKYYENDKSINSATLKNRHSVPFGKKGYGEKVTWIN